MRIGSVARRARRSPKGTGMPLGTNRTPCWASIVPALARRRLLVSAPAMGWDGSSSLRRPKSGPQIAHARQNARTVAAVKDKLGREFPGVWCAYRPGAPIVDNQKLIFSVF